MMKKTLWSMVLAFVMVFIAGSASAVVINFDFQAWSGATPPSVTYSGQGALSDPGNNYWNSGGSGWATYSQSNLKASDGTTTTTVDFAVTVCKNYNWFDGVGALMGDYKYIDAGYNPATITLSQLTPNTPYRLYLYAAGNPANKGSKFTSNSVTKETTGTVSSQFIKDGNYVILDTLSDAVGTIIVTWQLRAGAAEAALNGFQITDVVPHPTDLNDSGKVDMKDFAILSQGWRDGYEMADLLNMAEDWLLIVEVAFLSDPIMEVDAVEGIAYSSTLSDDLVAFDAPQLTFSKLTGPGWLTVAADGTLGGTPSASDIGLSVFTIQVEDGFGHSDQARVDIAVNGQGWVAIYPQEYPYALRNPLMGFRPNTSAGSSYSGDPYATVTRCYIRWNEIENYESDTIDKIKTFCNTKWKDAEKYNVKVIPRVYLDWDWNPGNEYWPADMDPNDYTSDQFKTRLRRLIQRLGQCWNNDPRVAWVQMGIIGYWGEQETPWPTAEIQQLMGDEFTAAFPNKKVIVRRPKDAFTAYPFGGYWDSWAHINQFYTQGAGFDELNNTTGRWKVNVWEGEVAYNWGDWTIQPGQDPTDTATDPVHRNFLIDSIRDLHCSALGWISAYSKTDPAAVAGAEEIQRAFGYRYLLNEVKYPAMLTLGADFSVQFKVINVGSAPFYYKWPVEISLLNPATKAVVWHDTFDGCDIRNWLSGDQYNSTTNVYTVPAVVNTVSGTFQLPGGIANGEYILALAILDPSGMLPSVRFSTVNYFNGGRHPIGYTGVSVTPGQTQLSPSLFNDPASDRSLYYSLTRTPPQTPAGIDIQAENYTAMSGIQLGGTTDTGGGQCIGYIENGDWAQYTINIPAAGSYPVDFRVASATTGGTINMVVGGSTIGSIAVAGTGGWQTWTTVRTTATFSTAGTQTLRLNFVGGSGYLYNINWFKVITNLDTTAPAVPTGLVATAGQGVISLNWNDTAASDLWGYGVYRAQTSGGPYTHVQDVFTSDWKDYGVTVGTTYYYVVTAMDKSANESGNSNEGSASLLP
jgi:hypothetical protein